MKYFWNLTKLILILLGLSFIITPIYFLIFYALMSDSQASSVNTKLSLDSINFQNFLRVIDGEFWRALGWTILFSVIATIGKNLVLVAAAYGVHLLTAKYKKTCLIILMFFLSIPEISLYFGWYQNANQWSLSTNVVFIPLTVPVIMSFFSLSYFYQAFEKISKYQYFLMQSDRLNFVERICYFYWPKLKVPLIISTIFGFLYSWNSFLWPNLIFNDSSIQFLGKWFRNLGGLPQGGNLQNLVSAGAVIVMLLSLLMYWINSKWINKNFYLKG